MDLREKNKEILKDTLEIIETCQYVCAGKTVHLKENAAAHRKAVVITQEETVRIEKEQMLRKNPIYRNTVFSVSNRDSYDAAVGIMNSCAWKSRRSPGKVMVLNFANPVHPGGGVRYGAVAQEEDLCRRSTLLASLECPDSRQFYEDHRKLTHFMASDAMLLSPSVEIFRRGDGRLMEEPVLVSVLTCAAPAIGHLEQKPDEKRMAEIFYQRIMAMLHVACEYGYEYLVLGAWGCGAFGNDAKLVAEQFAKAFCDFRVKIVDYDEESHVFGSGECFRHVEFAVLDHSDNEYHYQSFRKAFPEERYREYCERVERNAKSVLEDFAKKKPYEDAIRGCLVGGGAGDALGYPVEFWHEGKIRATYGQDGITSYQCSPESGLAFVSDDTQMTMFTVTGILQGYTRESMRGIMGAVSGYVYHHYLDWLHTQDGWSRSVMASGDTGTVCPPGTGADMYGCIVKRKPGNP